MERKSSSRELFVKDLFVTIKNKDILHGVNTLAHSGDLLAVMGPTGSGKTTLLNAIAGKINITSGDITLNGMRYNKQLRRRMGYVHQEDALMTRLTLYETLFMRPLHVNGESWDFILFDKTLANPNYIPVYMKFTAMIRIPELVTFNEKQKRIQNIVDSLDIQKCLHTVIGDMSNRGLSGGEKKRANIACELLTDPDIMLVDEPTSGLDSSTAHSLMLQLKTYATHYNKTIITTIHQPSSQIYHMFSTLLLLMDGTVAYFGKAADTLDYFEAIGLPCAIHFNPADFLLTLLKSDDETKKKILSEAKSSRTFEYMITQMADTKDEPVHYSLPSIATPDREQITMSCIGNGCTQSAIELCAVDVNNTEEAQQKWPTSFWTQYRMLTWRTFKQSRGHIMNKVDIVQSMFVAMLTGTVFFQIDLSFRTLRDQMGVIVLCLMYQGIHATVLVVTSFSPERAIIRRERDAGAYRLSAYYAAKITSELPLLLCVPLIFFSILYWMVGIGDVTLYVIFVAVNLLYCLIMQCIGHVIGSAIFNPYIALKTGTTYTLSSFIVSGYFNVHIPPYLEWLKYFSIIHYAYASLYILCTEDLSILWCNTTSPEVYPICSGNVTFVTRKEILQEAGVDNPYYCYIGSMGIFLIILRVLGYYILKWRR